MPEKDESRSMSHPQSISVVILTYKRPDELDGVLENLFSLTRPPEEIIVFDDDAAGSGREAGRHADPRVQYLWEGRNFGPADARNHAVARATGDILVFLDDDSRLADPQALQLVLDTFADETIGCLAFLIRNAFTQEIVPKEYPGYSTAQWEQAHDVSYFIGAGVAVRRQAFLDVGGFDDALYHGEEEIDLSIRLVNAGWRIRYVPEILVFHRKSPKGRDTLCLSYRLVRNRGYLAVKYMPFPYLLSHLVLWGGFALLQAIRARQLGEFVRGLQSLWRDHLWERALRYRRAHPMPREAVAYMRRHEGRLWY